MKINKLAIVRSDGTHACPYGLSIQISCKNVGKTIYDMQVLNEVEPEQREKYKHANRRVYRHSAEGERCPFADKLLEGRDFTICDYGEAGAGEHSTHIMPSPYYPRVFGNFGQQGLYSIPIGAYTDNSPAAQTFGGMFSMYSSDNSAPLTKEASDPNYYEFDGNLPDEPRIISIASIDLTMPDGFEPLNEECVVYVRDIATNKVEGEYQAGNIHPAEAWAQERIAPGKKVDVELKLFDEIEGLADNTPESYREAINLAPERVHRASYQEAVKLLGTDSGIKPDDEIYFQSVPEAFFRFSSIDGQPLRLAYRKLHNARYLMWISQDPAEHIKIKQLADKTVDFFTSEGQK